MNVAELRRMAVASLVVYPSLAAAMSGLGFVQADPIRAPARAQDLMLRQRVPGYHAGDLERDFASLGLEEDMLYAYGFMTRPVFELLRPRSTARLSKLESQVLASVRRDGETHPSSLITLGSERVLNAWGGYSQATKKALEHLHARGLLRISRRERGIRIYAPAEPRAAAESDADRLSRLAMVLVRIFAPAPEKTIRSMVSRLARHGGSPRGVLEALVADGELARHTVDGVAYVLPVVPTCPVMPPTVRLLAPFDPLVWDRVRFEHLWGWAYRFEAYTPVAKRVRGYYALPLLYGDAVIGWANVAPEAADVDVGFVGKRPRERAFSSLLEAEIERMRAFLI